jgi:hypothetical protein
MVGLIDIAPATETVEVQGKPVTVFGVSARVLPIFWGAFLSCAGL